MAVARRDGGEEDTKHTPPSLLAHKWERGLCAARYLQGTERKHIEIPHSYFFFVHQCTQDGCVVVIFLPSFMLLKVCVCYCHIWGGGVVFKESTWEVWLEGLFLGTSGFFRFWDQMHFVGFMGVPHLLRS